MVYFSKTKNLINLIYRLINHFSSHFKRKFVLLIFLIILGTFAEVVSIGAVLPFLAMLTDPVKIFNHPSFAFVLGPLGITSANQMILLLTTLFIAAALFAGIFRILLMWLNSRLTAACGSELSMNVYRRILYQTYDIHLSRNSNVAINAITYKVNSIVNSVISSLFSLLNSVLVLVSIIIILILINPIVALASFFVFATSYVLMGWMSKRQLYRNSKIITLNQNQLIKVLQESLGGIRDIILEGSHLIFSDLFVKSDIPLRRANAINSFIGQIPRFVMEIVGIILIATIAYYLSIQPGGIKTALPIIGALGIGSQRLLPAIQQIYNAWTNIISNNTQLVDIIEILDQPMPVDISNPPALYFKSKIQLNNVRFKYNNNSTWILDNINISIPKGSRVGFIGRTGTGKSTLLDVIMGLLIPTEGGIQIDDKTISGEELRAWRRSITHVPQSIFLADCSIAENIAFGVPSELIDMELVKEASKIAQISDFINSIPEQYHAMVGERGVRISGGQRQRIGIARALYKHSQVLVFDEATSALDTKTELAVMDAILALNRNLTILIIAHRLSSLKDCDLIIELENGKILRQGSYESLIKSNES